MITGQLWIPAARTFPSFTCMQRDHTYNRGLHFFNLQQRETYSWLKRVGRKELKKCLVDDKNPPVTRSNTS